MPEPTMLANRCMMRPTWALMSHAYNQYKHPGFGVCWAGSGLDEDDEDAFDRRGRPRNIRYRNQCAVRMSVALERCGFSLNAFGSRLDARSNRGRGRRVHRGRGSCRLDVPHVLGAAELARYLDAMWSATQEFRGRRGSRDAFATLSGRRGIIYFNDCFRRRNGSAGDHIDLWDGSEYWNQKLGISAGGGLEASTNLFNRSNAVKFFVL